MTDQAHPETWFISYPGSGYTWMTCLVHQVLLRHFEVKNPPNFREIHLFHEQDSSIPLIMFTHGVAPYYSSAAAIKADKSEHRNRNIALIVRDPRDVIISCYFKHVKQTETFVYGAMQKFEGTLSEYLRDELYGIEGLVVWLNNWAGQRYVPRSFSLIRYTDMIENTHVQLKRALDIIGINDVAEHIIGDAVQHCSFENMQAMENDGKKGKTWFYWVDPTDPESHRMRRGKVGGYTDYMNEEDIQYVNTIMKGLNPFFGYLAGGAA